MTQNLSLDGRFERVSKPRYWWWGSIQSALRAYPRLKQRYEMPDVALTARYAAVVGHDSAPGRPTEMAALQRLYDGDYKVYLAIKAAIDETAQMETGRARLAIIDLLYFRRICSLQGASMGVGYSYGRAKEVRQEFIRLVAYYMGYLPKSEVRKKFSQKSQKGARK